MKGAKLMEYEECLEYIANFPQFKKEPSLKGMEKLLEKLGEPNKKLRCINVAGTNGKGSTVAMLSSVLSTAGYKTGRYISPFVLEFRERMMINGKMIGKKRLAKILELVKTKVQELYEEGIVLNAFEITTASAMLWFAEENCDFVVLEAGLGGRFDATNTIPEPILQIITAIGLDHTEQLGDTIAKITEEKCGILRHGCTLLTSPGQNKEALSVMLNKCNELDATFVTGAAGKAKVVSLDASGMDVLVGKTELSLSLGGKYQINNLLTVYSAVSILREKHFTITDEHLVEGIAATKFPARFELCSREPMVILDGAHNPQAAEALAESVEELLPKKRILLCGMMADKDYKTAISILAPHFEHIITVNVQNPRTVASEELAKTAKEFCADVTVEGNASEALEDVLKTLKNDDVLVVAGSLYLASELRPMLMRFKGNPNGR